MTTSLWIIALGIVALFAVLYHVWAMNRVTRDSYRLGYDSGKVVGFREAQARQERGR